VEASSTGERQLPFRESAFEKKRLVNQPYLTKIGHPDMKKNTPKVILLGTALAVAGALMVPVLAQDSNSANKERIPIFTEYSDADGKVDTDALRKAKKGGKGGKKKPGKKAKKKK
jgi:hypothetical protein